MSQILKGLLILDLLLVNAGVGYLIYKSKIQVANDRIAMNTLPVPLSAPTAEQQGCDSQCQKNISDHLAGIDQRIKDLETKEGITPIPTPRLRSGLVAPKTKVRTTQYVTIPGNGSSSQTSWESLAGTDFYFDTGDYPGLVEVYFEATVKLFNGNGMAYVRLLDETHGIGVQGSEVSTNSQAGVVVVSGKVSFWAGRNLIRVQARSLTADTAIYSYGRLKVVTEN